MAGKGFGKVTGLLAGVILLGSVAAVFLIQNFGSWGLGATWPAVVIAAGLCVAMVGYLELGLGVAGIFVIWLLCNLAVIPPVGKSWPFFLIWMAVMVVVGFIRGRSGRAAA
jgi:hypothetical protein